MLGMTAQWIVDLSSDGPMILCMELARINYILSETSSDKWFRTDEPM